MVKKLSLVSFRGLPPFKKTQAPLQIIYVVELQLVVGGFSLLLILLKISRKFQIIFSTIIYDLFIYILDTIIMYLSCMQARAIDCLRWDSQT